MTQDFIVTDISLADWGRKELAIAETEMPGLLALRDEFGPQKPLKGARVAGCLHMTVQTAVLIETLVSLGADVRWSSCNIYSTQDQAAAAIAASGVPVFAKKGETLAEYWEYVDRTFDWADGGSANMILDDGGDATMYILLGARAEAGETVLANPASEEEEFLKAQLERRLAKSDGWFTRQRDAIKGVRRDNNWRTAPYQLAEAGGFHSQQSMSMIRLLSRSLTTLWVQRIACDGIRRATDVMLAGKVAVVAGYGDVGKGSAASLRQGGARVMVTEVDPICALQAAMEGYEVVTMEQAAPKADIFVTATGNRDVITIDHMRDMKDRAIVCNIGHFDNEIQVAELNNMKWSEVKPQVDEVEFPDGKKMILLAKGRLVNLGCATGHPSFVMSASFTNQVLAQIELWNESGKYENQVYTLPRHLDEKVAALHLAKVGAALSELRPDQADYIGVSQQGPFKSEQYRY